MKCFTIQMTLATAALTLAAGMASAQGMKAEIPFSFRVGNQVMQPGEYRVSILSNYSGNPIVSVASVATLKRVMLAPAVRGDAPREWKAENLPKLSFLCGEGPCSISRMWMGDGSDTLDFPAPHKKNGDL